MSNTPLPRRQPAGIPVGGQFAHQQRQPAGIVLSDPWTHDDAGDDPWADPAPVDEPTESGWSELEELTRTADLVSMACSPVPSMVVGDPDRDDEAIMRQTERINDAQRAIVEQFGSVEQATTYVGGRVAARAEHLAGISAEDIRTDYQSRYDQAKQTFLAASDRLQELEDAREQEILTCRSQYTTTASGQSTDVQGCITAVNDKYAEQIRHVSDDRDTSSQQLWQMCHGTDPVSAGQLRQLSDGYVAAVGEMRPIGGQMVWHPKSTAKARAAFDEATEIFPSDWVDASNARVGRERTVETTLGAQEVIDEAPVVKISKRRAHYADVQVHRSHRQVPDTIRSYGQGREDMATYGRSSEPFHEFESPPQAEAARSPGMFIKTNYTVASRFRHGSFDERTPPSGRGWEKWTSPEDPSNWAWRRVQKRTERLPSQVAPEITTNDSTSHVQGRSGTYAVATHEMSHRFETSVSGITRLESQFLARRTTDPTTGEREPLRVLYPGRRPERAQADEFITAYMGKHYDGNNFEVLSMGTDSLHGGRNGGLIGVNGHDADEDMRQFILGVHACAGRTT